jgi:hypothetical protein
MDEFSLECVARFFSFGTHLHYSCYFGELYDIKSYDDAKNNTNPYVFWTIAFNRIARNDGKLKPNQDLLVVYQLGQTYTIVTITCDYYRYMSEDTLDIDFVSTVFAKEPDDSIDIISLSILNSKVDSNRIVVGWTGMKVQEKIFPLPIKFCLKNTIIVHRCVPMGKDNKLADLDEQVLNSSLEFRKKRLMFIANASSMNLLERRHYKQ